MHKIELSCVVAVADNGVIGNKGGLPWKIKSDLRRFRKLTMGHPLIMGRKTYESIGNVLDGRDSIVVSRFITLQRNNVVTVPSLYHAIDLAKIYAINRNVTRVFVIGGSSIFNIIVPICDNIFLTKVHGSPIGDKYFDELADDWVKYSRMENEQEDGDEYSTTDFFLIRRPLMSPI